MSLSMIPEDCFWCDNGKVEKLRCMNCGATYGNKLVAKKKKSNGFVLPTVREANPVHLEKRFRPK